MKYKHIIMKYKIIELLVERLDKELRSARLYGEEPSFYVEVRCDSEIEKAKQIIVDCGYKITQSYRSDITNDEAYCIDIE